jgi:serine-type D-Ala-D-Ala carboxypeptidase/endopeptidase (penicillin-binding protein 4)
LGAASWLPLVVVAPGAVRAQTAGTSGEQSLPSALRDIMAKPIYDLATWQIYAADLSSGEPVYDLNGSDLVVPGSVTKLFIGAATLAAYAGDYRFKTPVFRTGPVDAQGNLMGDLILVASGDLTMGGRNTPDGHIDFESIDHTYANDIPNAMFTPENPVAGLDDLAAQVAQSGITHVSGNVIIDARLWAPMKKDEYVLSPIMINDNVIDLTVTPGSVGQNASVDWRPQTPLYQVQSQVQTVAADQPVNLTVNSPQPGQIVVDGQIPAGHDPVLRVFWIDDAPSFARSLFIQALQHQGVTVDAIGTGDNPASLLPPSGSYSDNQRVALLTSLPFSENLNLIFKVSQNNQADTLVFLLALKNGNNTFDDGMQAILPFLQTTLVDTSAVSLGDGRGNDRADLFSPYTVTQLLRSMSTRPDYAVYRDALPLLGEKGSESQTVPADSPVAGKAAAKSGTTSVGDLMNQRIMTLGRGLGGYMTTQSGRSLVFSVYAQNVPAENFDDLLALIKDQGTMVETIYLQN